MIKLNKLAIQVYNTALRSKEVTRYSSERALILHISKKWRNLVESSKHSDRKLPDYSEQEIAAADVILETVTYLRHIGCNDIEKLLRDKIDSTCR